MPKGSPGAGEWTSGGAAAKISKARSNEASINSLLARVAEPDGGFTYQPLTDDEPHSGFAVSPYPQRSFAKDMKDFTFSDLVEYAKRNDDLFKNSDHYMGAWHDPASDKVFLDVSVISKDEGKARQLALKHDQIAYFDLGKMQSVTVNKRATSGGVTKL